VRREKSWCRYKLGVCWGLLGLGFWGGGGWGVGGGGFWGGGFFFGLGLVCEKKLDF